jgi:energy-coupling factor transport system substrate-specific component
MLKYIRERFAEELTGPALPFVAFCIALNLTAGQITAALKIPLYLDSIGTILVAVLVGPWSAVLCGSTANILASAFGNPAMMFFIPVVAVIGAFTGYVAKLGWFRKWYLVGLGGILQGVLAAIVSAPISAYLFSGVMMSGTDFLVLYFRSLGNTLMDSVLYQGLASDPVDKLVSYAIVFLLVRNLPLRLLSRLHGAVNLRTPDRAQ